jgi:hypothetical protein
MPYTVYILLNTSVIKLLISEYLELLVKPNEKYRCLVVNIKVNITVGNIWLVVYMLRVVLFSARPQQNTKLSSSTGHPIRIIYVTHTNT